METTLHRQFKEYYADGNTSVEVRVGKFRIDAVRADELIEIQLSALAAIREKVRLLVKDHRVLVVKPIPRRKFLTKRNGPGQPLGKRRLSPKRGALIHVFDELVHFTTVFPHFRLTLELLLVDIEERRCALPASRRRRNRRQFTIEDQRLIDIVECRRLQTAADLLQLLPADLPVIFDTGTLAAHLSIERWRAQRIAYTLRRCGAVRAIGKNGKSIVYQVSSTHRAA